VGALLGKVIRIPTVAIGASDVDGIRWVHISDIGVALNTGCAFSRCIGFALAIHIDMA
jgi:hypothetical protein